MEVKFRSNRIYLPAFARLLTYEYTRNIQNICLNQSFSPYNSWVKREVWNSLILTKKTTNKKYKPSHSKTPHHTLCNRQSHGWAESTVLMLILQSPITSLSDVQIIIISLQTQIV